MGPRVLLLLFSPMVRGCREAAARRRAAAGRSVVCGCKPSTTEMLKSARLHTSYTGLSNNRSTFIRSNDSFSRKSSTVQSLPWPAQLSLEKYLPSLL
jgi:hypothetical protein